VPEPHTLDVRFTTPPIKPHTLRANKYTSVRATYPKLTIYNTALNATYSQANEYTSARATYSRLTFYNLARKAAYLVGQTNTPVLELHTLYLPFTTLVTPWSHIGKR
jgi:hypothetical protein